MCITKIHTKNTTNLSIYNILIIMVIASLNTKILEYLKYNIKNL